MVVTEEARKQVWVQGIGVTKFVWALVGKSCTSVMVNFVYQLDKSSGCQDRHIWICQQGRFWMRSVFELVHWIKQMLSQCGWASSNLSRAWVDHKNGWQKSSVFLPASLSWDVSLLTLTQIYAFLVHISLNSDENYILLALLCLLCCRLKIMGLFSHHNL